MANPIEFSVSPDDEARLLEGIPGREEADPPREDVGIEEERDLALQDLQEAFGDYGIPVSLAEHALAVSGTESKTAADREEFANRVLDAKRDLDEDSEARSAGRNDWRAAIEKAAREPNNDVAQAEAIPEKRTGAAESAMRAAVQQADAHWRKEAAEIQARYPGLTHRQVMRITLAADRQAWVVSKVPQLIRDRLGIKPEEIYDNKLERAYQKIVDKKADALLEMRSKALVTLRGVRADMPPHLLPSKHYRAAEVLTRVDQQLRKLRPLKSEDYGAAIASATGREINPTRAENERATVANEVTPTRPVQEQRSFESAAQVQSEAQTVASKHESALQTVRELRAQTPVDGYRSKAAEAMTNRLVQQLQEGRETIVLSAKYQGRDQGQANATHRNAVEANADLIQAVRERGIPVDTGVASLAFEKKSEVELNQQVERGQSI